MEAATTRPTAALEVATLTQSSTVYLDDDAMIGTQTPLTKQSLANVFSAETGLLCSLRRERVSHRAAPVTTMAPPARKDLVDGVKVAPRPPSEAEEARGEVLSLPTHPRLGVSTKKGVGVEEMRLSRKERQEQAVEAYNKRRGYLNVEIELRTGQAGSSFKQLLALNDSEIASLLQELHDDFLTRLELHDVQSIGRQVAAQAPRRATWIAEFESELDEMEGQRRQASHIELCQLMDACVEIGHMLPAELERELEKLTAEVNFTIISNKQVHADLVAKLRVAEVRRQRDHENAFAERLAAWRKACHEHALAQFKELMRSPHIVCPDGRREALAELREQQRQFAAERATLLASLECLTEETLTAEAGEARASEAAALQARESDMHERMAARLRAADADTEHSVQEAMDKLRTRLEHFGHAKAAGVDAVLAAEAEPLARARREAVTSLLASVDATLARQLRRSHEHALGTLTLFRDVGAHFDHHHAELVRRFREFRKSLHDTRQAHEHEDREAEGRLDTAVLRLRQDATEAAAAESLREALDLLSRIEHGYQRFASDTRTVLDAYPPAVDAECARFGRAVHECVGMLPEKAHSAWLARRRDRFLAVEAAARAAAAAAAAPAVAPAPLEKGGKAGKGAKGAKGAKAGGAAASATTAAAAAEEEKAASVEGAAADAATAAEAAEEEEEDDAVDPYGKPEEAAPGTEALFGTVFPEEWRVERILEAEARGEAVEEVRDTAAHQWIRSPAHGEWYRLLTPGESRLLAKDTARERAEAEAPAAALAVDGEAAHPEDLAAAAEAAQAHLLSLVAEEESAGGAWTADEGSRLPVEVADKEAPLDFDGSACVLALAPDEDAAHGLRRAVAALAASHHESRAVALVAEARTEVEALRESVRVELDERLLAHRPRSGRLELDVQAARLDQLLGHRERFGRHARYVAKRNVALRSEFADAVAETRGALQRFVQEMGAREAALRSPKTVHVATLERLRRDAEAVAASFKRLVQTEAVAALRQRSKSGVDHIHSVNATFAASLVPWSEGGTYHPEEVAKFKSRLDALDAAAERHAEEEQSLTAALAEELVAKVEDAELSFAQALKVSMEDVSVLQAAKSAHSAGATAMRAEFAESDEAEAQIATLAKAIAVDQAAIARPPPGDDTDALERRQARLLRTLDELRMCCFARAKYLEVLDSQIPEVALDTHVDGTGPVVQPATPTEATAPAEAKGGAKREAGGGKDKGKGSGKGGGKRAAKEPEAAPALVPGTDPTGLLAKVEAARANTEGKLNSIYEQYYEIIAGRLPTRTAYLKPSAEEAAEGVRQLLTQFTEKAVQHRRAKSHELRTQLLEIESVLPAVAAAILGATQKAVCDRADAAATDAGARFDRQKEDTLKRRRVHEASLKPSLSNPNRAAELSALEAAEEHRLIAAKDAALSLQAQLVASETAHATTFVRRHARVGLVLAAILDHFVFPLDLVPPEEPPAARRKPLRAKLVEAIVEENGVDMPAPPPGRKFPLREWPGIPADELQPAVAGLEEASALAAAAATEATGLAGAAEADAEGTTGPVEAFVTPAHRAMFASRDRVYAAMRTRYYEAVRRIAGDCRGHVREEETWSRNWAKMTAMLRRK